MKSQFRKADASGARWALVIGPDEKARGEVLIKNLRDGAGAQSTMPVARLTEWVQTLQSKA